MHDDLFYLLRLFPAHSLLFSENMGRNLDNSSLLSFPGLVIGNILAFFQLVGKVPLLRQPLYIAVM